MAKTLTIYGRIVSPFVARVVLAARAKGFKYDLSLPKDGIKSPAFYKLNPFAKLPVLKDGATTLFESAIIVEYLDAKSKAKKLVPASATAAAQTRLVAAVAGEYVQAPAVRLVRHKRGTLTEPMDMKTTLQDMAKGLDTLERVLLKGRYAAGARLTIADCFAAPALFFVAAARDWYELGNIVGKRLKLTKDWASIQKDKLAVPVLNDMAQCLI